MTSVHDLSVWFDRPGEPDAVPALDTVSATFAPGEITALIGGDSAGKSTLLKALAGRVRPHEAHGDEPADPASIGYQGADGGVWPNLLVDENIAFVARTQHLLPADARGRTDDLLDRAGLTDARDRLASRLSGGMRQKLGFILATLHRPELVLLDEPTTGVDPTSRQDLWALMVAAADEGATVIVATTYLDEAEHATQVILLSDGRVLAAGAPAEVTANAPGTLHRASIGPDAQVADAVATVQRSPYGWRRADAAYLWEDGDQARAEGMAMPPSFRATDPDLENAAIAYLLHDGTETAGTADAGAERGADAREGQSRDPLLRAEGVGRDFGAVRALTDVSLHVDAGEVVGLVGGNGAGKTTLMRIVLGLEKATAGSATLFGRAPSLHSRKRIGYVAQGLGLYPALSAGENLAFAASVHGVGVGEEASAYARAFGGRAVGDLPLGARRMLAYLAANVHGPDLLILDEPTSGMDPLARARLWKLLRGVADRGVGVLVTTHYMQEAMQCDRLAALDAGRVVDPSGILAR